MKVRVFWQTVSVINPLARELSAKIVYYGPGLSGKTTSLAYIHTSLRPSHRGELISLSTEGDRTLFFDFLPVHLGRVGELDLRLQIYTVPGQIFYGATRRLVLEGADGVVFVADSQAAAEERNLESFNDLKANLKEFGSELQDIPFVIQYNKRDLPNCLPIEEMRSRLNPLGVPDFPTCAAKGEGVSEALKAITRLVVAHLSRQAPAGSSGASQRQALAPLQLKEASPDSGFEGRVRDGLNHIGGGEHLPGRRVPTETPSVLDLKNLPANHVPPIDTQYGSHIPIHRGPEENSKTIQAPAQLAYSFSAIFPDPKLVRQVEQEIARGAYAEAVYRAAGGVSVILDGILGPNGVEGSATRAQLLGLDGREYLKLRRLGSRPAANITEEDSLFALYVLIAVRMKEATL